MARYKFSKLSLFVAAVVIPTFANQAFADYGSEIVTYRCNAESHVLYVGTSVAYGVVSGFGKDIISLFDLPEGGKTLKCQISSSDNITVKIGKSVSHPNNNNLSVTINGKYFGTIPFEPEHDYSYIIQRDYSSKEKPILITSSKSNISRDTQEWKPNNE